MGGILDIAAGADSPVIQVLGPISSIVFGLASLVISIVAMRLTREQARSYLFAAPALYLDSQRGGLVIRNYGPGAMITVWVEIMVLSPGRPPVEILRNIPSIGPGETALLMDNELVRDIVLAAIRAKVRYQNIARKEFNNNLSLTADQLGEIG